MAAKKLVKCLYCGESFDVNSEPFVKPNEGRRYAHQACYDNYLATVTQEEKDREEFYAYMKKLYNGNYNFVVTNKMATKYIEENHYTYSGMTKTLKYFYEVKKNSIEKSKGSIGIIPYCYNEAQKYFQDLEKANKRNEGKVLDRNLYPEYKITIPSPQVKKKKKKLFSFLDKEE